MSKKKNCLYYDKELDCCDLLSEKIELVGILQPCIESPCEHYRVDNDELKKNLGQSCNDCSSNSDCEKAQHIENYRFKECKDFKNKNCEKESE